eukprot:3526523-Alexandrium_andersonii.AAC.2
MNSPSNHDVTLRAADPPFSPPPALVGHGEPGRPPRIYTASTDKPKAERKPKGSGGARGTPGPTNRRGTRSVAALTSRRGNLRERKALSRRNLRHLRRETLSREGAGKGASGATGSPTDRTGSEMAPHPAKDRPKNPTTLYDDSSEKTAKRRGVGTGFKVGARHRIATLSVQGLLKTTMQHQITSYMMDKGIGLMAITETHAPTSTKYATNDHLFLLSSADKEGEREYAGVGFVLHKKWVSSLLFVRPEGPRHFVIGIREALR